MEQPNTLEALRHRLEHEDNLVNHRLSWILTSQAFLLSAYAILLNAPQVLRSDVLVRHHATLVKIIPFVGFAAVMLMWLAILAALIAMRDLRLCASKYQNPDARRIHGTSLTRILGMTAPVVIPIIFMSVWVVLICS